ncbi:hypothetical protein [Phocaeicola sp.]
MKKMKLAVVFAALVSVFGFSSCLNDSDSGPQANVLLVTVSNPMGMPQFYPDCMPGVVLTPTAVDLTPYGISSSARRAIITYTIPEGQNITNETKKINITLVAGACVEVKPLEISNVIDSFDTKGYTSKIKDFINVMPNYPSYPVYPKIYADYGYLNFGFTYNADKIGQFGLVPNRISNDTLYLDLRAKIEGSSREGLNWLTYNLTSCNEYYEVNPIKDDSIRITVLAKSSLSSSDKNETIAVTTSYKKPY